MLRILLVEDSGSTRSFVRSAMESSTLALKEELDRLYAKGTREVARVASLRKEREALLASEQSEAPDACAASLFKPRLTGSRSKACHESSSNCSTSQIA